MPSIEFKFEPGTRVRLIEISRPARIQAVMKNHNGEQYQVIYWADGTRQSSWVYGWELQDLPNE